MFCLEGAIDFWLLIWYTIFDFYIRAGRFILYRYIRGSSNGRTAVSGTVYLGSNPGPRANKNRADICPVFIIR